MKRFGTILLLLLTLQYTFGLFTVYVWSGKIIKQNMKAAIATGRFRHNRIITLSFSAVPSENKVAFDLREDEMELDGKMYDVVSARQEGSRIIVQAISDNDETSLTNAYRQAISGKHTSSNKSIACLKGFFSPFISTVVQVCLQPAVQAKSGNRPSAYTVVPPTVAAGVLTPPPRTV